MTEFGVLVTEQIPRLKRYARALARDPSRAEDLVQGCLVRALDKSHLWQPGTDLRAWLFTLLHNQYVNEVRSATRQALAVRFITPPTAEARPTQEVGLALRDLQRALARLSEEQWQAIALVAIEGMSYEAAADILDVPVGTVRSRVSRGRDRLRNLMDLSPGEEAAPHRRARAPRGAPTALPAETR